MSAQEQEPKKDIEQIHTSLVMDNGNRSVIIDIKMEVEDGTQKIGILGYPRGNIYVYDENEVLFHENPEFNCLTDGPSAYWWADIDEDLYTLSRERSLTKDDVLQIVKKHTENGMTARYSEKWHFDNS